MTDYSKLFIENPLKTSEPMIEYYKRLAKKTGKSYRTIGDQYNKWLKLPRKGILEQISDSNKVVYKELNDKDLHNTINDLFKIDEDKVLVNKELTEKEADKVWQKVRDVLDSLDEGEINEAPVRSTYPSRKEKKSSMHILLPCVHIPFENVELLTKIVELCEDYKDNIAGFHIMGDFLDMLALSKHELNSVPMKGYSLGLEYEIGNAWLDIFETVLPSSCRKTFLYGNHEDRFKRHFNDINNSVYKDVTKDPISGLRLKQRGYEVYTEWKEDYVMVGNLMVHHGFLLGQNPAKQHLDKLKCSNAFGHTHRIGSWFDGTSSSYNLGCLADLESPGMKYASRIERLAWANGFGICYVNDDNSFQMNVINVNKDNSFWFGNKKY